MGLCYRTFRNAFFPGFVLFVAAKHFVDAMITWPG